MNRILHPYWTNYSASENGSVYGSRGKVLKPIKHHTGYSIMTVRRDGVQKQLRIHRFVWECFYGEIPEGLVINHINGNKRDNRLKNLEVVTNQENIIHSWQKLGRKSSNKGSKHHNSKIDEKGVRRILELCKEGKSNKQIALLYDLHPNYVSLIRHNKRWKHIKR